MQDNKSLRIKDAGLQEQGKDAGLEEQGKDAELEEQGTVCQYQS